MKYYEIINKTSQSNLRKNNEAKSKDKRELIIKKVSETLTLI